MILEKLNPAVDRKYLVLLAGIVWCGVGIMLITIYNGISLALFLSGIRYMRHSIRLMLA